MTPAEIETDFTDLRNRHIALCSETAGCNKRILDYGTKRDEARAQMKSIEASMWVNGGSATRPIDGKNEKLRDAQHQIACESSLDWARASQDMRSFQSLVEFEERELAGWSKELRGIELAMQLRIEQFQYLNTPRFYRET